jgi:Lrp/AsnC family transcriptional regulator for asnA, asnC and gidA
MNVLDYLLIYELQKTPHKTNLELARQFGVSVANIRRHIAHLVSSGTLKITAIPNASQLGYHTIAYIGLQIEAPRITTVAEELKKYPNLHYIGICSGSIDILTFGFFTSNQELSEFISTVLGEISGILNIDTLVVLKSFKVDLGLQPGMVTPFGELVEENGSVRLSDND